jgi:hypothetical protein
MLVGRLKVLSTLKEWSSDRSSFLAGKFMDITGIKNQLRQFSMWFVQLGYQA